MDDINADDAEFGMSDHKTHNELRAEIASLRAELADESPGTPLGRLNAIGVAAEARGLCTGVEAKPAEVFLIEAFDALRAALMSCRPEGEKS